MPGISLSQPSAARFATAMLFAVNGGAAANWIVRIPAVQEELDLSTGTLGVALLGVAVGSLVSMPPTGWLVARLGSRPVSYGMALALCAALPLPALAPGLLSLVGALILLGAGMGGLDVAMNAQGVTVQRRYDRPIISAFHAVFSLGGLAGAAVGGAIAELGVDPLPHLVGVAVVSAVVVVLISRWLLPAGADAVSHGPMIARPSRALAALGILAFCVLMGEGAMADWTAVFLRQTVETSPGVAAAGYAVFSLTMAAGRLVGDQLVARFGPVPPVRLGGLAAALGLGLALATAETVTSLIGFGLVGAGLSFTFPIVLTAASRTPGMAPSVAIAAISTAGYLGFLAGPPLIGLAGEVFTLRGGLMIVVALGVVIAMLSPAVSRRDAV